MQDLLGQEKIIEITPPSTAGMTTRVVKGTLWTLAGQIAPLAFSLVTTPFVIRLLGVESYGVFILVGLIPTYLGFADFGMGTASKKFASEAYAQGSLEQEARIVRTSALIALLTSFPLGVAVFIFSGQIVTLFNVPADSQAEASLALKLASVTFVLNFLCAIFNTPQLTRFRMDLNTAINAGFKILGLIATPIVLYLGGGIVEAVFILLIVSVLTLAGHLFISRRLLSELFRPGIERTAIRPLLKFGVALVIATLAGTLLGNVEKGILSGLVSVTALAHYSVAFSLASMMTMFSTAMTQSLIPAFSQLSAIKDDGRLSNLYSLAIRMNTVWLIPALVFLAVIAKPFFTIWAGEEFGRESVLPFYLLLVGLGFNIIAYVPSVTMIAAGRTDVLAKLYWLELAPYILLVWLLTARFGINGAAIAWSLRAVVDVVIQLWLAGRFAGVTYLGGGFGSLAAAAAIMLVPLSATLYFQELNAIVAVVSVIFAAAYALLIWKWELRKEETDWLRNRFRSYLGWAITPENAK